MDEDVIINADRGATLTINSDGRGISAGDVIINGGTINISAKASDAIWADSGGISFSNSDVLASGGWTGVRAATNISVNSGRLDARATSANPNRAIVCSSFSVSNQLDVFGAFDVDGPLERYNDSYAFCRVLAWREEVGTVNVDATWEGTPKAATASTINTVVTNTKWYKRNGSSWTELTASDTIKNGSTYRCEVTLEAICGTTFHRNYTVRINGKSAYKKSGNTWYLDKTKPGFFTTQPQGGTVVYNQRHIAEWATNFTPVKQELVRYSSAGNVVQVQELNADAVQASCSYLSGGLYYRIRAYYDYSSDAYVESDPFYVTTDPYFTPNYEHGNEEGDIIAGITYVPNGDGTFNANVHVDLSYVDGQMLQHEWYGTGYYWYDHDNRLHNASVDVDTSKLVFTLYDVGKNLEPGKEWRVKVYLAYDPYCDDEWREVDFHYVTDTVPELKPEDVATPEIYVGGVGMYNGKYLAVGATTTQTTKPSGGYAYYNNGVLTLNNYNYEGAGYLYLPKNEYYAIIYAEQDLTVELVGSNTLTPTNKDSDGIYVNDGSLTIGGAGSLTNISTAYGLYAKYDITINGGTIVSEGPYWGIICIRGNVIINGGDITASGSSGILTNHNMIVNGGKVEALAIDTSYDNADRAIYLGEGITIADGLEALASETVGGPLGEYVAANHNNYKRIVIGSKSGNPFTDVKEGDFYYDPVMWAVENGITTGATATTFNPGGNCLRAHVVTFLHRAAGNPAPSSTKNPFKDVKSTDFFYKPVLWAVEKGITNGTSATTFGSYDNCNRAAVVTFLWRNAGSPEPKAVNNPFVDVKTTDFFYKAVLWAVENGITNGVDATHFGPATACNRAQVVTFLYRAYN